MLKIVYILVGIFILLYLIRIFVMISSYYGWRDYDKEWGTEYRFNLGYDHLDGVCYLFFRKPVWLMRILEWK